MAVEGKRRDFLQLGMWEKSQVSLPTPVLFFHPHLSVSHLPHSPALVSSVMLKAARCVFDCFGLREDLAGRAACSERRVGWRRLSLRLTFNKFVQQSVKSTPPPRSLPFYYLPAMSNA